MARKCSLASAVKKATACGMSYGKWVAAGCPEPPKKSEAKKQGVMKYDIRHKNKF